MPSKKETKQQDIMSAAHFDFQKGLNSHAFFKINNKTISEELVQDTFLKTWKYLVKGGKILLMKAFLYHILNNLIIDEYRKHKTSSLDVLLEKGFDVKTNNEVKLLDQLDGKKALLLIARLPIKYQKIMRMKYVQDLTLSEMSLLTGKPKKTLAVQLHRGLEKLKLIYEF